MMGFRWWDVKKEWWDNTAGTLQWSGRRLGEEPSAEVRGRCGSSQMQGGRGEPEAGRSVRARAGGRVRYHRDQ